MKRLTYLWLVCLLPVTATASAAPMYHLTTLVTFNVTNGSQPYAGLIADASGNLYGTTSGGGANLWGTVFELSPVPEPSSLALTAMGILVLVARRTGRKSVRLPNDCADHIV